MRTATLTVLVLLAAGGVLLALIGTGDGGAGLRAAPALPAAQVDQVATAEPAPARPAALVEQEPAAPRATTPIASGPRTLDGTVSDRFGQPVVRERVWLLDAQQGHPPPGAPFGDYVTALTSSKGVFSLTLRDEGPYRLAVGPPGEPRFAPTEPRTLVGRPTADVIVPGGTSLRVTFEGLPESEERLSLELLTLREGSTEGRRGGFDRGSGGGDRTQMRERFQRARGGDAGPADGGGGRRGGAGGDAGDETRRRRGGGGQAMTIAFQDPDPDPGLQDQTGRRGRGRRGRAETEGGDPVGPPEPPPEVWRAFTRRDLSVDDIASGSIVLSGLPAGRIARLALRVGRERIEGVARFTLLADVQVEVRVFPVVLGEDATLEYIATSRGLGPTAPMIGVRWGE